VRSANAVTALELFFTDAAKVSPLFTRLESFIIIERSSGESFFRVLVFIVVFLLIILSAGQRLSRK
jgi:hypothetical protein